MEEKKDTQKSARALHRALKKPGIFWLFCFALVSVLYSTKLFSFFSSAPILYLTVRQGPLAGFFLLVFSGLQVGLANPLDGTFFLLATGTAAWVSGFVLRHQKSISKSILYGTLTCLLLVGISMGGFKGLGTKIPVLHEIHSQLKINLDQFYLEMEKGLEGKRDIEKTSEEKQQDREFFQYWSLALLPGALVSLTALSLWMYFILLRRGIENLGFEGQYQKLSEWKIPDYVIWILIVALIMVLLKVAPLQIVMKNALILLATAYLFQGISVWADTMKKRNFSPGIKLLSYFVCILFFHFVAVILVAVGIIDIWINFRKVKVGAA